MSQDLRNFLIGIGVAFAIMIILGTFFFGSMLMYQMGKNNTANEVVTAVEKVGVTANETKTAVTDVKNGIDQLKTATEKNTAGINELKGSVEKIAAKEPVVKVVRIKPEVSKQDDQSATIQKAVENGLTDVKKSINDLGARMDRLEDGQKQIGNRVERVEKKIEKVLTWKEKMEQTLFGKIQKQPAQQNNCDDENLSGNK